ncbi:MAG: McrC family protein [Mycobacteriales bacterium]
MIRIDLRENGDPLEVELPDRVGLALAGLDIVSAVPSITPGVWTISATSRVGVARIGEVELWIEPKLDIRRLFFLLGYALTGNGWQDADVDLAEAPNLLVALARAFARQADKALQQGLLQGYRTVEEALPVLRGRLRETEQVGRRYGLMVPVEVRFDEYTADIAENQLLRAAAKLLLRLPRIPKDVRRSLLRLILRLSDISTITPGHPLPRWQPSRLNIRYHLALRIARLVLQGNSVEHQRGSVRFDGFLINMAKLFEDFVTVALSEALAPLGGRCRLQDRWHLDDAEAIAMKPDLVWYDVFGRAAAIVDAKYKAEKSSGFPDADLYQMLAYCTAVALPRGHLVYAKGNEAATVHTVRNVGIEIIQHAVDLDVPPDELVEQMRILAAQVSASRSDSSGPALRRHSGLNDAASRY